MNHVRGIRRIIYPVVGFDGCSFDSGRCGKFTVSGWVVSRPAGPRFRLTPGASGDAIPVVGWFRGGRGPQTGDRAPCTDEKALLSMENIGWGRINGGVAGRSTGCACRFRMWSVHESTKQQCIGGRSSNM